MPFLPANEPQLIRSSQKDEYYLNTLRNNASEAFQILSGSKKWLEWRKEIELLADIAYYCLTNFGGYQTLGEEYVSIVQVDSSARKVPSTLRRGSLIFFHTFVPYLLDKIFLHLEHELQTEHNRPQTFQSNTLRRFHQLYFFRDWMQKSVNKLTEEQKKSTLRLVVFLKQAVTFVHRLHVAIFYLNGTFYHIGKRITGIKYVRIAGVSSSDQAARASYRLLGVVSVLQLALTVALQINNFRHRWRARQEWKQHRNLTSTGASFLVTSASRISRCSLCLEERRHATTTPCGHLFCWECITEWCNTKAECPLCREKFQPSRLVYLRNYR
ncbi:peroxisome biogenesis factor 10 [Erpetoichthys calabaricus]|uniref:RING-type E3 ubiquitin transferase n=1 Tax=Erpetoichthys calabaricus TaxID=27687 RepID=A0A8C4RZ64_ERPCA|nr:peroxisome biogenesis factor 10 [Erpetoichthys calabaricus]XP_028663300.1 peroxisome biogenesis factor 10 [Erpetoichthys calabaricus]